MKVISITLIFLFSIITVISANPGILADYSIEGISIGQTKLKGNARIIIELQAKRLTANFFYQEAGTPFPNLDEKDIIINFKKGKKYIFTSESGEWLTSSIEDDYSLLDEKKVKITIKKSGKDIITKISMDLEPEFGGKQKYIIRFSYLKRPSSEVNELKKINKPSGIDFLSLFIDNEKLIELLNKKMAANRYRVPDKFKLIWEQDGEKKLDIRGILKAKSSIMFSDSDFEP